MKHEDDPTRGGPLPGMVPSPSIVSSPPMHLHVHHHKHHRGGDLFHTHEAPLGGLQGEAVVHSHDHHGEHVHHGHTHERWVHPGFFRDRDPMHPRDYRRRAFTVGIGGPVGSGKTALVLALCRTLRDRVRLGVVTNDIFTREDAEFLHRNEALPSAQIRAVETGGCPHAAIREDISPNLDALEELMGAVQPELLIVESGGDNLAAQFSRELVDYTVYVIDVAGGDKVPRKGGPGITQSDLLVINKVDLAPLVGASLDVMERDSRAMRGDGPFVFAEAAHGKGVDVIVGHILNAKDAAYAGAGLDPHS